MKYTRKGFFKSIFGGLVAASTVPSLVKSEEATQPPQFLSVNKEILRIGTILLIKKALKTKFLQQ